MLCVWTVKCSDNYNTVIVKDKKIMLISINPSQPSFVHKTLCKEEGEILLDVACTLCSGTSVLFSRGYCLFFPSFVQTKRGSR
jgi:hypothetical protein